MKQIAPTPFFSPCASPACAPLSGLRRAMAWAACGLALLGLQACGPDKPAAEAGSSVSAAPAAASSVSSSAKEGSQALTVTTVRTSPVSLPIRLSANGDISAWQEASVGSQSNGLPLQEVLVNVGDVVKRGQVLARFNAETVQAELAQMQAALAEAEAVHGEAAANAERVQALEAATKGRLVGEETGLSEPGASALSAQQIDQYMTAERTAKARVMAQLAAVQSQKLRLSHTQVVAPDDGVISARQATVGAVMPAGQELFRLIRQGRLEWRAEVNSQELARLKPGAPVLLRVDTQSLSGVLRQVAPTADPLTRNALVYVDLPAAEVNRTGVRPGMFARGEFELGESQAMTLPQTAVMLRDGFSTVMRVGPQGQVSQLKVEVGRRVGERIEILSGLPAETPVVASGVGFLADGDRVRVVASPPAAASALASAASATPARP